jgi:Phosphodiester glycosidase
MLRRALLLLVLLAVAAWVAPGATAAPQALWPGVTYDTVVQFTPNGPVAINVITGPPPGGETTTLAPVLSNGSIVGRETITSMQRRMAPSAATAGVNGDFFTFATGAPSGIFMRDTVVASQPSGDRSSAGLTADGRLDVRRVSFFGTWKGQGPARALTGLNKPPPDTGGVSLFTSDYGAATPATKGTLAVTLFPFPAAVANADLQAPVVDVRTGGRSVPIPVDGAVLVAKGASTAQLAADAPRGSIVRAEILFKPAWPGVVSAIGGGPQIVRAGAPVFRAGEAFTSTTLGPREARTAVGQLRDGRLVLVAVDGRQPHYSVGLTNFELAQALVRLGAVTAMALDGGGSTTMAFDGKLLNRPSNGAQRPVSTALMFEYTGAFVEPPRPVVSPNGDRVDDTQSLRYRLVRPSTVSIKLTGPGGAAADQDSGEREPGAYVVSFPPQGAPATSTPTPTQPSPATTEPEGAVPAEGDWTLALSAVDDLGRTSQMEQTFIVNSTLGFLRTDPAALFLPPGGRPLAIAWQQTRRAVVTVTVEQRDGRVLRRLARRPFAAGEQAVRWNGLVGRKPVKGGVYVVRIVARNELGSVELTRKLRVRRIVGK